MSEHEEPSPVEILGRLSFVTIEHLQKRASEAGLTLQQMRLLGILRDREPTINALTTHLDLDKSSVSGLVIRAERRGLVSRTPDEQDGRAIRVRLEPAGRALIEKATAQFETEMREAFAVLTADERDGWVAVTSRLLAAELNGRGPGL